MISSEGIVADGKLLELPEPQPLMAGICDQHIVPRAAGDDEILDGLAEVDVVIQRATLFAGQELGDL